MDNHGEDDDKKLYLIIIKKDYCKIIDDIVNRITIHLYVSFNEGKSKQKKKKKSFLQH